MARRRLTIKRIDPWSVLKFGAFLNIVLYLVYLVVAGVVWFVIDRLRLIDQACEIALDVGFTSCEVEPTSVFQVVTLLGAMGVIVLTAVLVFLAFLHNLIADLTGGLVVGIVDDTPSRTTAGGSALLTDSTRGSGHRATAQREGRERDDTGVLAAPSPGPSSTRAQARAERPRPDQDGEPLFDDQR
ncbi:MAG: DUF3566 domain-containing protein [Nitriliruptoraceae bacterium]